MGSKVKRGTYDCYHKADADEPLFTLIARDPLAGRMVALWAALRGRKLGEITLLVHELIKIAGTLPPEASEKLAEAEDCANEMDAWLQRRRDAILREATGGQVDTPRGETPITREIKADMRRAALDRLLLHGNCTTDDLIEAYGFTALQVLTFGAGAIDEARRLIGDRPQKEAAA